MKKILFYSLVILFCGVSTSLSAQQSKKISLQGFLKDANGKAVEDGPQDITFKLYTVASAGTEEWMETQTINVFGGVYSTQLGISVPIENLNWGSETYFVGVTVQGIELTPRTELTFAPYSLGSPKAQEVVCSGAVGDVKYSILNPTQFALQNGDCWIPMDGRPIIGSKLAAILTANSQSTIIVNAGGQFIRGNEFENSSNYDPNRSYSTTVMPGIQGQDIQPHFHPFSSSVSVSGSTDYSGSHRHDLKVNAGANSVGGYLGAGTLYDQPNAAIRVGDRSPSDIAWVPPYMATSGSHNHSVTSSGTVSGNTSSAGSNETRPVNINLWTYIRIN